MAGELGKGAIREEIPGDKMQFRKDKDQRG
jgi:hypothetical protein